MAEGKQPHAQKAMAEKAQGLAQKQDMGSTRLLRRPEVESLTGLSRSTLYAWMQRGEFPQPVKLGERLVAWRENDVTAWLESRETRVA